MGCKGASNFRLRLCVLLSCSARLGRVAKICQTENMILFRPVGLKELELIAQSDFKAFPPRLEIQPIFYPVLNFEYAAQIAREWNTKDPVSGFVGFVTEFEVDDEYASKFEVQIVGGARVHQDLWVPAEELAEFNSHIVRTIKVTASFAGPDFKGKINSQTHLPDDI